MPSSPSSKRLPFEWAAIRDRIDLVAVAEQLLGPPARRSGRRLLWQCPFHDDHDPSFIVDHERQAWKCWPCNLGGDAVELVMRLQGLSFPEAVRRVADMAGIVAPSGRSAGRPPMPPPTGKPSKAPGRPPERPAGLPLADALALVTEAESRLWRPEGAAARECLHGRGLDDETIRRARLGWTPSTSLLTRDGSHFYRVRGIVIPWFEGDRLSLAKIRQADGAKPRYAEAYRDSPSIFPGPDAIRIGMPLVITEGEFDALLLGQELWGVASVVTLGSASVSMPEDVLLAMLCSPRWFAAHDADDAGDRAAAKLPSRAIRMRPPATAKDWSELHMQGSNRIRYHWGRYLPMSLPWEAMEPKGDLSASAHDEPDPQP